MSAAADRIRAMREKGTITAEQADELLKALAEDEARQEPGTSAENARAGEPGGASASSGPRQDAGDEDRRSRRGRRRSGAFLDMDWVGDMVDGITSGLGAGAAEWAEGKWKGPADNYRYEWDHRWSRRRAGNAENSSRVERPEGEQFEFQDNRAVFSKIAGLHLVRSKVRDNSFSASTFKGADLVDSTLVDSSLAGASLHDLRMDHAEMKDVSIAGSKVSRLDLQDRSGLKNVKFAGSSVSSLDLEGESWIEDTRVSGTTLSGFTLSGKTRIKDTRLSGSAANEISLRGASITDTRLDGCKLANLDIEGTEIQGCAARGVSLHGSTISGSRIKDSRFDAIGFRSSTIERSELKSVVFRDLPTGYFWAEHFHITDSKLDDVHFVGCRLSNCTIRGVKASHLLIRGRDLSGRTIERAEDLREISEG